MEKYKQYKKILNLNMSSDHSVTPISNWSDTSLDLGSVDVEIVAQDGFAHEPTKESDMDTFPMQTLEQFSGADKARIDGTVVPEEGQLVGRYEIVGTLGRGSMGVVYRAIDPQLQREVAIKIHRFDSIPGTTVEQIRKRLFLEGQALARISDPNVVTVYDVGYFRGQVFVAMELISGHTLDRWLTYKTRTQKEILGQYIGFAAGLSAAHRVGLVHRDVKPENAIVGNDGRVRVVDFGIANFDDCAATPVHGTEVIQNPRLTAIGTVVGTPAYISPEQLAGLKTTEQSDQFSFCVSLWESLSDTLPYQGNTLEERARNIQKGSPLWGHKKIPHRIRAILEKGLQAKPENRYPGMESLSKELHREYTRPKRWLAYASIVSIASAIFVVFLAQGLSATALERYEQNQKSPALLMEEARPLKVLLDRAKQHYHAQQYEEASQVLTQIAQHPDRDKYPYLALEVRTLKKSVEQTRTTVSQTH